jgi:outer membrane cobalamin receptor
VSDSDSLAKPDTVTRVTVIEGVSSILSPSDSSNSIAGDLIRWGEFDGLGHLLWQIPGGFLRDLGSVGQPSQLMIRELGWRHIGVFMDGRPTNEPLAGVTDLNVFPLEMIDRIEYQTGVRAFLAGLNSTGGAVNIVSSDYYTNRPYSLVRYSEGAYSFGSTDGIFSQNLTRRINLTGGFQRRVLDGRYPNSNYEAWSVRFKARYLLSDKVNVVFSELYTGSEVGLNGGVDLSKTASADIFDELVATVRNTDSYEKMRRHDLNATVAFLPFQDSSATATATAYFSNNLRQYRDEESRTNPNGVFIRSDHESRWFGLRVSQKFQKWGQDLRVTAETERREVIESPNVGPRTETLVGLTGKAESRVRGINAAIFARYDHFRSEDFISWGADARLTLLPWLACHAGYSISYRAPTIQELYWVGGGVTGGANKKERHRLAEGGFVAQASDVFRLKATYFHRHIDDPIVSVPPTAVTFSEQGIFPGAVLFNGRESTISGVEGILSIKLGPFFGEGTWTLLTDPRDVPPDEVNPKFFASGEVSARMMMFDRHLDLKVGLRGKFFTTHYGEAYNPEAMVYVENFPGRLTRHGTADLFIVGKVGSARIHLLVENVTDEKYMLAAYYPMLDRSFRFGIEWEFLD